MERQQFHSDKEIIFPLRGSQTTGEQSVHVGLVYCDVDI